MSRATRSLLQSFDADVTDEVRRWFDIWQCEGLFDRVAVRFSARMFRSVGRCYPADRELVLASAVQALERADVLDILCHELAHLVAFERFGRLIRPHGHEWRALVQATGHTASVRCDNPMVIAALDHVRRRRRHFLHVCPHCRAERVAAKRVTRWRCGACYELGGDGRLQIIEVDPAADRG